MRFVKRLAGLVWMVWYAGLVSSRAVMHSVYRSLEGQDKGSSLCYIGTDLGISNFAGIAT
jgi:membrane protein CcdC involved in cytochrome C biogenesis